MYYFIKGKVTLETPDKEVASMARQDGWKRVTKSAHDQQARANTASTRPGRGAA
jgi:hypothetical protein